MTQGHGAGGVAASQLQGAGVDLELKLLSVYMFV